MFILAIFNPLVAATSKTYLNVKNLPKGEKRFFNRLRGPLAQQGNNSEQAVIRANRANYDGSILYDVTILSFAKNGSVTRRLDAQKAIILDQNWQLENVKSGRLNKGIVQKNAKFGQKLIIPSNLTKKK